MNLKVHTFFEYAKYLGTEEFPKKISKIVKKDKNGYAGWDSKDEFKISLEYINQGNTEKKYPKIKGLNTECRKIINNSLEKIKEFFDGDLFIYVFPTNNSFVINKMGGSTGITTNKNTIYLEIFPTKNWKKEFESTIIHEMVHVIMKYEYNRKNSVGEALIHDGMAENFRESLLGGREPFTKAISKKKAIEIFEELKPILSKEDTDELHAEIFFGAGKYPLWSGYTIGYYLVKDYLKEKYGSRNKTNWKEVFNTKPREILNDVVRRKT